VDEKVATWWREERSVKGMTGATSSWEDFKQFLRSRFVEKSVESDKVVVPEVQANVILDRDDTPLRGMSIQLHKLSNGDEAIRRNQRCSLFQTQCTIKEKACKLIIDSGSYCNGISRAVVASLGLSTWRIPEPKHVAWLNSCGMLKVTHKVRVPFTVGDYVDEVECDVLPLEVCGLLLGRPWQYDRNVTHAGRANTYSFVHDGKQRTLKPMRDDQIKSDVELVIHKEKLRKAKPKSGLATPQHEEHDVKSIDGDNVSAKPVDDKPVVLVSDKPVEIKPLIAEGKDMSACVPCVPLPVRVDIGVQTDDGGADRVPVHMVPRVVSHSFARTPRRRFVGAAVRVHTGKDGRVRQLCGPGITTLQGRAKQVHVQQRKVPARIEMKKVEAPKYKFIWRRKEVQPPRAVSSRAGQEGGCGEEGKQDLKTANMRGAIDIPPPFRADPHALGTTLFEGGEDDMGTTEEVKPNFRTPPR
jgi:hypothetical protein